jgi:hypothetical protein
MPVAAARKIEWLIREQSVELDVQLRPIVLDHEQCLRYQLPRTPIKEAERRAANFEQRFGGATELDALMAIHPGELERIVEREVLRYFDQTLADRFEHATHETARALAHINSEIQARHAPAIRSLRERYAELNEEAESLFDLISEELEEYAKDVCLPFVGAGDGDEDHDPLFISTRDYVTQIDRYRSHQGKPFGAHPKKRAP